MSYRTAEEQKNWRKARKFFGIRSGDGRVLHHVDETMRYTNPERYKLWLPEDLEVLTQEEHNKHHHQEQEWRDRISKTCALYRWYNNGKIEVRSKACPDGYVSGRLPRHWFNNGEISVLCFECPDGFIPGRL